MIDSFADWATRIWDVDALPKALGKLSESTTDVGTSVGKKVYMLVLRHALGGEKVCFLKSVGIGLTILMF